MPCSLVLTIQRTRARVSSMARCCRHPHRHRRPVGTPTRRRTRSDHQTDRMHALLHGFGHGKKIGDGFEAARCEWAALHPGAPPPLDVVARSALAAADWSSTSIMSWSSISSKSDAISSFIGVAFLAPVLALASPAGASSGSSSTGKDELDCNVMPVRSPTHRRRRPMTLQLHSSALLEVVRVHRRSAPRNDAGKRP